MFQQTEKTPGRFLNFFRRDQGSSVVEYAVVLGALVGCLMAGLVVLGPTGRQVFERVANLDPAGGQPVGSPQATAPAAPTAAAAPAAPATPLVLATCALAVLLVCSTTTSVVAMARNRRLAAAVEEETASAELQKPQQDEIFNKRQRILNVLSSGIQRLTEEGLEVGHIMTAPVISVPQTATVEEVRETMTTHRFRHLMVCDDACRPVGIISDRDVRSRKGPLAKDIMNKPRMAVSVHDRVAPAITWMMSERVSCLPVTEGEKLVGIFTSTDVMMAAQCLLHVQSQVQAAALESLQHSS